MKKFVIIMVMVGFIFSCKGPITGHEYSKEDIIKILKFIGVSAERIMKYKKGEITLDELKVSRERVKKALDYLRSLKEEADNKTSE